MFIANNKKVAVIGVGSVGAATAYALVISGLVRELALVDVDRRRAEGEAMDLAHSASFIKPIEVYAGGYEDCHDADIIVYTAGANQRPGETRLDLVQKNLQVLREVLPRIMAPRGNSILLMVANPVDILTYAAIKIMDLPPGRVMGSGTVLDSSRFRYLLSENCRVEARNIHAYVVGEHGDTEVPLWSLTNIAGLPVDEFTRRGGLPSLDREDITRRVRRAAYDVIVRKGATYYAIGLAVKRICESILRDENSILTVSGLLEKEHGLSDVCLSLPSLINRYGRVRALEVPMDRQELDALRHSAGVLGSIQRELDLTPVRSGTMTITCNPGEDYREDGFTELLH